MKKNYGLRAIIPLLLCCSIGVSAQDTSDHLTGRATAVTMLIGGELYQTSKMNGILEPRGYPPIPELLLSPGVGAQTNFYQFDRSLLLSTRFRTHLLEFDTDTWTNRAISFFGSTDLGYMFTQNRNIITYAAAGGTFGTSSITRSPRKNPNRPIEEVLDDTAATGNAFSLHTFHFGLHLEAGIDFLLNHHERKDLNYIIGLKAGKMLVDIPIRTLNGEQAYIENTGIPGYYVYLSLGFIFF